MSSVIDQMPNEFRQLFERILIERAPDLLATLRGQDKPTMKQRELVDDIFATKIIDELDEHDAPSELGQRAKRTIEEFWALWPSDSP